MVFRITIHCVPRACIVVVPIDGVLQRRRRTLQIIRAECVACRHVTAELDRQVIEGRSRFEAAQAAYRARASRLAEREAEDHRRLALALRDRSESEEQVQRVRDVVDGELRARRTAGTVLAHRLDARWRKLRGRYRGFVEAVLSPSSDDQCQLQSSLDFSVDKQQQSVVQKKQPRGGDGSSRFFAVADLYRRESLRASRSLRSLVAGRRPTEDDQDPLLVSMQRDGGESTAMDRVLNELHGVQLRCARIAERVRWRKDTDGAFERTTDTRNTMEKKQLSAPESAEVTLATVRNAVEAGRSYIDRLRRTAAVSRWLLEGENTEEEVLRRALFVTCRRCDCAPPASSSTSALKEMTGRLELACFTLFARLDFVGTDDNGAVVESCLRTVRMRRQDEEHRKEDTAHRLDDFRKAAGRLMTALGPSVKPIDVRPHGQRPIEQKPKIAQKKKATTVTGSFNAPTCGVDEMASSDTAPVVAVCPPRPLPVPTRRLRTVRGDR
ncbi:uncharacterized protein LOC126833847 [Adelges cooleyi]|uniref:uncharacterized protein LOC126833847 n=1 Tax=Adelges cooleyi TaxID=133065 RepID=UPI00217F25A4|nr:uncharacterized protein LOC126833847 [Adelges cooleyi]